MSKSSYNIFSGNTCISDQLSCLNKMLTDVLDSQILTVHERKKPHVCHKCNKSFGQKSTTIKHSNVIHFKILPTNNHILMSALPI